MDNVLKSPQPAYQNLDYVSYLVDNTAQSPAWQPDAAQWVARGVDNPPKTPQPYVRSPLFPDVAPFQLDTPDTFIAVLNVEGSEALLLLRMMYHEIRLELNTDCTI